MSKEPLSLRFAKNVEMNRQRLIENCRVNGKTISDNASLSQAVTTNNTITMDPTTKCIVRYFDLDGTLLTKQNVTLNDVLVLPSQNPNFDDEYLTFVGWKKSASIEDVDGVSFVRDNAEIGARYVVAEQITIDDVSIRPTIIKCHFNDSTDLSPTINYFKNATSVLYIDWGDGVVDALTNSNTTGTVTHTYTTFGHYVIKLYSTGVYGFNTNSSRHALGSQLYNQTIKSVYLGDNFELRDYVFQNSYSLEAVVIPDNITIATTMTGLFYNCYSLHSVVLPDTMTATGSNCFYSCSALKYVILPRTLTTLSSSTFSSCLSLQCITIPNTVTFIDTGNFSNCEAIEYVKLPQNITSLSDNLFSYCYSLRSVIIPENVVSIGASFCNQCYSLKSLVLPDKLERIGSNSIYNCYSLEKIHLPDTLKSTNANMLSTAHNLVDLRLPENYNQSLSLEYCRSLTDSAYVHIANQIKNLTGETAVIIRFVKYHKVRLENIYLNANTGELCAPVDENAISLIDFIRNKNWTVVFSG